MFGGCGQVPVARQQRDIERFRAAARDVKARTRGVRAVPILLQKWATRGARSSVADF